MEDAVLVTEWGVGRAVFARAELTKVFGGARDDVGEELEFESSSRDVRDRDVHEDDGSAVGTCAWNNGGAGGGGRGACHICDFLRVIPAQVRSKSADTRWVEKAIDVRSRADRRLRLELFERVDLRILEMRSSFSEAKRLLRMSRRWWRRATYISRLSEMPSFFFFCSSIREKALTRLFDRGLRFARKDLRAIPDPS